jgi:hypothetical protein
MKEVKIIFGQTVLDIAVQELGDASRAMELAILNGISLTDELSADQVLVVPVQQRTREALCSYSQTLINHKLQLQLMSLDR